MHQNLFVVPFLILLMMDPAISILHAHEIDRKKWNDCVLQSRNGLVYAISEYLDHVTDNWSGIIYGDYRMVMPVPWRKKYGITYTYDVPFIQQLGIVGEGDNFPFSSFLDAFYSICKYGSYHFNFMNRDAPGMSRINYVLPLDESYINLSSKFSEDVQQNIRRSHKNELNYQQGSIEEAIGFFRELYGGRLKISDHQYHQFGVLCRHFAAEGKLLVKSVSGKQGHTLATALLLNHNKRLYNIMNSTIPEGRKQKANYFLFSSIFMEFQQSEFLFDFEGSDVPGIGEFYRKFSAINQPYMNYRFNRLPWPVRLLKK